jgi:hypothetical protein
MSATAAPEIMLQQWEAPYLVGVELTDEEVLDGADVGEACWVQGMAVLLHAHDVLPFGVESSRHAPGKELKKCVVPSVLLDKPHKVVNLRRICT